MNRKKIIFFLPIMSGGGAERVTINIIKSLNRDYFEPHLVLGTKSLGNSLHLIPKNIYIYDLKTDKTIYSIFKLRKIIKKISPYFIYSSLNRSHIAINLALIGIGIKNRPKTIMRIPSSPKLVNKYIKTNSIFNFFLNKALQKADTIIVQTPEMREETEIYHNIEKSKIKVLINPLDIDLIKDSLDEKNPFEKHHINVIASGRLSREKGFDILIKAFKEVYIKNNNFRLYIIGPDYDNQKKKYMELIRELDLANIVTLLGFKKNPYKYYQYGDLFVLSSRWEGLPNAVLENLYLKKPIIATKCIPFMSTLIADGENGFLVEVETIKPLANRILRYKELKNLGKANLNNSSVNNFFRELV